MLDLSKVYQIWTQMSSVAWKRRRMETQQTFFCKVFPTYSSVVTSVSLFVAFRVFIARIGPGLVVWSAYFWLIFK